ncbi:hypothetical protein [Streptomyces sp. NRRL F-5135]|uniref:hypothetical protein n=1 Tax=Streptomyces sp. NRRL F-5135 TaxID=1463858 RepID=UPI0004C5D313|nr:hypothetical protein [Streptomyces sp. NRRL F-5135]
MGLKTVLIDAWSRLNFKPVYSDHLGMPNRRAFPEAYASWVPAADERRLAAYKLFTAYDSNQAAELAEIHGGSTERDRREYGDPSMFVDTLVAHVMGRGQTITVPGAEHAASDEADGGQAAAERVQDLLRDWAETELLPMRMKQAERKAVSLGDAVYRLAWDPAKERVTLRVSDPGFYFPVIGEDDDGGEYPQRIHFAWELPEDKQRNLPARLRRITYELDWIRPATASGVDRNSRPVRAPVMTEPADGEPPVPSLGKGDVADPDSGAISRIYPWSDKPSYRACYLTDATWELGDIRAPADVDSLPLEKATFATRSDGEVLDHLDLLIDFIPVIHVPNTVPPAEEHWGQSSLAAVLQVFDELQGTDTDSARASATTGSPIIGLAGKNITGSGQHAVAPGMVFTLGENGRMDTLNTAPQLQELRHQRHDLSERAATVVRLPAVSLGTMDPSKVPSGYALALSLGPLDSLMDDMRLARDHKNTLLLKFVQRLHLAGQHPDWAGITPVPAKLIYGPYTPTDRDAVLQQVTTGVEKGVLSLETAVRMLTEAGFPIDDMEKEIEQIQSRAFAQARDLADALGNPDEVADFLGRKAPEQPPVPPIQLPPQPGVQPPQDPQGQGPAGQPEGSGGNP